MTQITKRIKIQNTLKYLSNYMINTLETTDQKLKAVENMQEFFEHEFRRVLKGDSSHDRCQFCGEKESLQLCEYCSVVYCTKFCTSKHNNNECLQMALDNIMSA
jgi:hypothetical protein